MKAWLGLGSNQQRPAAQLREALDRLGAVDGIEILAVSSFYQTPPWGDEDQDDFVNAVAQIETRLRPVALLHELQRVEKLMGRERNARRWGPRLIDIDMLLYGEQKIQLDGLEVPHPRMHERAFVLIPLAEIDPDLEIPGHGTVKMCLDHLDDDGIRQLKNEVLD